MTHAELCRALLVERFGEDVTVAREARAWLAGATEWTEAEQAHHAAELAKALVDAVVHNLPPRGKEVA